MKVKLAYLKAFLPAEPQVAAGQKAGGGVAAHLVDPALRVQLPHAGVDQWEARLALPCRRTYIVIYQTNMSGTWGLKCCEMFFVGESVSKHTLVSSIII